MNEQSRATAAFVFGNPAAFLAFGFGSGLSPVAPGTMGTLAAIPFALLLKMLPITWFWLVLVFLFALGIYLCGITGKRLGQHDPGGIVWDEMVAYWLTVAFLPVTWEWFLAAFVLFRVFDIVKPWPIRWVERQFDGGLGIMLDDIVAALYAMLILFLAGRYLLPLLQPA
jgi:phosphatidylglycerophosphatase A